MTAHNRSKQPALDAGPVERPANWTRRVNQPETEAELTALRRCVQRGRPYGAEQWVQSMAARWDLPRTLRPRGRPRKAEAVA